MLNRLLWRSQYPRRSVIVCLLALAVVQITVATFASAADDPTQRPEVVLAHSNTEGPAEIGTPESRPLEPRYQPREPKEEGWYNGSYIFGMTRGLADSTIAPAGKAPLFLFTIPLDIVLLPFTVIGGLFG
jgi:hypothetical protein